MSAFLGLAMFAHAAFVADGPAPRAAAVFDADPNHPWNRVHARFFTRVGPDGKDYGSDELEPLLWLDTLGPAQAPGAQAADGELRALLGAAEDACWRDPLKRAVMQRDLWLVANWRATYPDAKASGTLRLLAKALARLALTPDGIKKLPDNCAEAIRTPNAAAGAMPTGLFDPQGPWVCVGRTDGPTAPFHLSDGAYKRNPFNNSVFLVFVRHAEGRVAGLAFLEKLRALPAPLLLETVDSKGGGHRTQRLNRKAPQLPAGSQLALVRRMMVIASDRTIMASPITESVQVREITTAAPPGAATHEDLISATTRRADFETAFRRPALFRHDAGGLRDVSQEPSLKGLGGGYPTRGFGSMTRLHLGSVAERCSRAA